MDGLIITGVAAFAGKIAYDIAGPFAKDLGEMLKDELRPYRAANEVRILEKTARMVRGAQIEVHSMPYRREYSYPSSNTEA